MEVEGVHNDGERIVVGPDLLDKIDVDKYFKPVD